MCIWGEVGAADRVSQEPHAASAPRRAQRAEGKVSQIVRGCLKNEWVNAGVVW